MSGMDYRHCDACGNKAIYDAALNWRDSQPGDIAIENNGSPVGRAVDSLGGWAVVCQDCARTHVARVLTREQEKKIFKKQGKGYERVKKQRRKGKATIK